MKSKDKPYILYVADKIYLEVSKLKKRVKTVHQKLVDQNNEPKIIKDFKLLVENRVELTHKKLKQQKINQ